MCEWFLSGVSLYFSLFLCAFVPAGHGMEGMPPSKTMSLLIVTVYGSLQVSSCLLP